MSDLTRDIRARWVMGQRHHLGARQIVNDDMNTLSRFLLGSVVLAVALGVGFLAAAAVVLALNAMLPPFRPEDNNTLREFIPVALAYAAMAGTTLLVLFVAWRRLRSRAWVASRDIRRR